MGEYKIQIIESIVLLIVLIGLVKILQGIVDRVGRTFSYIETRVKIVKKVISIIAYLVAFVILILIWGIAPTQLAGYIASLFTVVGIAFLAQWSIISNITSTIIIFFNHQVNIGDSIEILDKEYSVKGTISDIGLFFIIIRLSETEYVSLPSNVFMQKMVKKIK